MLVLSTQPSVKTVGEIMMTFFFFFFLHDTQKPVSSGKILMLDESSVQDVFFFLNFFIKAKVTLSSAAAFQLVGCATITTMCGS